MTTDIYRKDTDWVDVKNKCRRTVGKEENDKEPSDIFKKKLLISEHSPIRLLGFRWNWNKIKYWVSTEWSRHKFEKFILSQRNDRQENYDRNIARQDAPVDYSGDANMQHLIDSWRKRLCMQATTEARGLAISFKKELHETHPYESNVLVPNCVYRCGCPEMNKCGYFNLLLEQAKKDNVDITNIQDRYDLYNKYFYGE